MTVTRIARRSLATLVEHTALDIRFLASCLLVFLGNVLQLDKAFRIEISVDDFQVNSNLVRCWTEELGRGLEG
jgi:hypothetical protein